MFDFIRLEAIIFLNRMKAFILKVQCNVCLSNHGNMVKPCNSIVVCFANHCNTHGICYLKSWDHQILQITSLPIEVNFSMESKFFNNAYMILLIKNKATGPKTFTFQTVFPIQLLLVRVGS